MPTINLPDDIAGGLTKSYLTTDGTVYAGLPPGVVIGVDVPSYPASRLEGGNDYSSQWGAGENRPLFLARNGVRVSAAEQETNVQFVWGVGTRPQPPSPGSPEWNAMYPTVPGDTALRTRFAPDTDHYAYPVALVFADVTGINTPEGDYVGYSVWPKWSYSASGGSILATFQGWLNRQFAFTIARGTTPPDPTPDPCGCHYSREAAPACNYSREAAPTGSYSRPACGLF